MEYVRQILGSSVLNDIFDLPLSLRNKKVEVIILPASDNDTTTSRPMRQLGFVKLPPLPESFFEPLPEEELQAWGL